MSEETLDKIRDRVIEYLRLDPREQSMQAPGYLLVIADILDIKE